MAVMLKLIAEDLGGSRTVPGAAITLGSGHLLGSASSTRLRLTGLALTLDRHPLVSKDDDAAIDPSYRFVIRVIA
jgi:hypothetical protein